MSNKERTIDDVMKDIRADYKAGHFDENFECMAAEARTIGEKMQAEINAMRGAIEAHQTEERRRMGVDMAKPSNDETVTSLVKYDDKTALYIRLPVHMNGLLRGHTRLPVVGHGVDPDGCAVIVRLGRVEFPLPVDFDPGK